MDIVKCVGGVSSVFDLVPELQHLVVDHKIFFKWTREEQDQYLMKKLLPAILKLNQIKSDGLSISKDGTFEVKERKVTAMKTHQRGGSRSHRAARGRRGRSAGSENEARDRSLSLKRSKSAIESGRGGRRGRRKQTEIMGKV